MTDQINEANVPQEVKDAFAKEFPNQEATQWEMEAMYEVEFIENGHEVEVNFFPDGTIFQIEREIPVDELPKEVKESIMLNFPHCEAVEVEKVQRGEEVFYEVDLKFEIHISQEGDIMDIGRDL